ncbi:MAG: helix-turn-helix transcriptional regulator [Nitrospiria bacterium]
MQLETLRKTPGLEQMLRVNNSPPVGFSQETLSHDPPDRLKSHQSLINDDTPGVIVIGENDEILFVGGNGRDLEKLLEKKNETSFETLKEKEDCFRLFQMLKQLRLSVIEKAKAQRWNQTESMPENFFSFREKTILCRGFLLEGSHHGEQMVLVLVDNKISEKKTPSRASFYYAFTPREKNVLNYVRQGLTNKEISAVLGIGVHTVKDHVKRIMKKVNVHTRSGIVGMVCTTSIF